MSITVGWHLPVATGMDVLIEIKDGPGINRIDGKGTVRAVSHAYNLGLTCGISYRTSELTGFNL